MNYTEQIITTVLACATFGGTIRYILTGNLDATIWSIATGLWMLYGAWGK